MRTTSPYRKGLFAIGLATVGLAAFASQSGSAATFNFHDKHKHKGPQESETRTVEPFKGVRIKGGVEMKIKVGGAQELKVSAGSDYLEHIDTYVSNGTLVIDMDEDDHDFWDDADVEIEITMPTLEEFEVLGAVDGKISGVNGGSLKVEIKGAADLDMEGVCDKLELSIKGAGDVDAEDLQCGDVEVDVKGVGSASVYASQSVDAFVGGIGEISVSGSPKVVKKRSGGIGFVSID